MATRPFDALDQESRISRALTSDFTWTRTATGAWACETAAGNQYLVSETTCGCPDWEHRVSKVGGLCKHQIALAHHLLATGEAVLMSDTPEAPARRPLTAAEAAAFDRIFGD